MLVKFGLELCQTVFFGVFRESHTVVGSGGRKGFSRGRRLVGADEPCCQCREVLRVRIAIRESALKVAAPVLAGKIIRLPQHPAAGIVENFPAFITIGKTVDFLCTFIVVEVVLAEEGGLFAVVPEHDDWKAVNALADGGVFLLGRCPVGAGVVVEPRQLHVVRALRGRHVRLEGEGVRGNRARTKLVGLRSTAVGGHKAALELDLVILPGIILRGRALHIRLGVLKGKAAGAVDRVGVIPGERFLISLVLRKLRPRQHQIRQILRKLGNDDVGVGVKDMIAAVAGEQLLDDLRVRDPVGQHLMPRQVIVVDADAVEVDGGVAAADRDADRNGLREVVIRRVLRHTGHDAVDIAVNEPVLSLLLNDKGQTNVLVFFVLCGDLRLLGLEDGLLGRQRKAAPAAHAGEHHGVVIHDVPCGKLHLYGLAGGAAVLCKGLKRNIQTSITCHTEYSNIVLVQLPAVRTEVKA